MSACRFALCQRRGALVCILAGCIGLTVTTARAGQHPTLLISPEDIPRLRHACGVGPAPAQTEGLGRAGARARDYQALRAYFAERGGGEPLPGELTGAAFLHIIEPNDPLDARRLVLINRALRQSVWIPADAFEMLLALDWCWDALEPEVRREFLLALREHAAPLTPADSPLDHRVFADKLVALGAALAIDGQDDPSPSWAALRTRIIAGARDYFEKTFPTFVDWRGRAPTSPAAGPWEECDTALALELASVLLKRDAWPPHRETVGRWLEHYVFASLSHPALQHHFIRDDGNLAPLSPAPRWSGMLPITAHLIAARTHDPSAAFIARRVEQRLRGRAADPLAMPWQWVPIVFETAAIPRCDFARLPIARNFGGAVVFRGRRGPDEIGVWIEAGQPYLRRRQHFDTGHFLIYSGGELTVSGGDDVALEAVPAKRGSQHLGAQDQPFDFEQYFTSTIAHNCLLLWNPLRVPRWYGRRFVPIGGQRLIEKTCTDFADPLEGHDRQTARQLAYGQSDRAAYLALDLLPAYDPRALSSYTREFVFFADTALVVIDRVKIRRDLANPVFVVNIPARPTVDGQDLPSRTRIQGSENYAGVWQHDATRWLRWGDGDGCLQMCPLLPEPKRLCVVGGPAEKLLIPHGPHTSRKYVGGGADGFERLVRPAIHARPQNAWYRLGEPTLLGPAFSTSPHWGRIEVAPALTVPVHVFAAVFVVETADATRPPDAAVERGDDAIKITLDTGTNRAILRLGTGIVPGGTVELSGGAAKPWTLPTSVETDAALPTD